MPRLRPPWGLAPGAALWIAFMAAAAVAGVAVSGWGAPIMGGSRPSLVAVGLCLLVMVSEWPARTLLRTIGEPEPWVFLGPMVVWLLGVPGAAAIGVGAVLGICVIERSPGPKWIFNPALRTVQVVVVGQVMAAVAAQPLPLTPGAIGSSRGMAAMLVGQLAGTAVAWTCVSVVRALAERRSLMRELTTGVLKDFGGGFLFAVVGPVVLLALAHQALILPLLVLPVAGVVWTGLRSARRRAEARTDELTGLPNRLAIYEEAAEVLREAEQRGQRAAFALLDLDGFKPINDRFGHEAGDEVLRLVGGRLRQAALADGAWFTGRLGGDEFVVVWRDDAPAAEYPARAGALRGLLRAPMEIGRGVVQVDASIGVAVFPHDGRDASALLHHADQAMYRAKARGAGIRADGGARGRGRAGDRRARLSA